MKLRDLLAAGVLLAAGAAQAEPRTWVLDMDLWGNPLFSTLHLQSQGARLTGDLDGDRLTGQLSGDRLSFTSVDDQGRSSTFTATLHGEAMTGVADVPDTNDPKARAHHAFKARRIPERPSGPPRTYDFVPTDYSNTWNATRPPVLTVWPGDTVHTTTIDSGGVDAHGVTRALFGNPQTGPFFVAGAAPGDTLVVRIRRLALDRDYADSLDTIVARALGSSLVPAAGALGKPVRWCLDRTAGVARPEGATGALANFSVPVRPMLGGLAVAPGFGSPPVSTGDTGRFGGNMDFPEVAEGATVYLPVQQPGALLYLGDAHALQGDGETSQYALETSMDVTITVDLIKGEQINTPRVESATQIMVLGQAGSLDEALKAASTGMLQWLQKDYGLPLSQAAQVLGSSLHFSVPNLAGRSVGVAARLDKARLPPSRHVVSQDEQAAKVNGG